jgi:predicted O-methyltransferase YrrM
MDELASSRPPALLDAILEGTKALGFSMASEPRTGAILRVLASSKPGGRFLELGTGTGISTAWLLDGMSNNAHLTTVDNDAGVQSVARSILGHDPRLEIVTADGIDFLQHQMAESFDLIFADAVPGKYEALNESLALLRKGGLYIIDDMLPQPNWPEAHGARVPTLLSNLFARSQFSAVSMAWSTGLVIAARTT